MAVMKRLTYWLQFFVIILFVLIAVGAMFWSFWLFYDGKDPTLILFLVLLCSFTFLLWKMTTVQNSNYNKLKQSIALIVNGGINAYSTVVEGLLASKVEVINSKEDLIGKIGKLYEEAAKLRKECPEIQQRIVLFGASDIQPMPSEESDDSDEEETSFDLHRRGRLAAEEQGVVFERFIRFFDETSFLGRSRDIQENYVVWLDDQVSAMRRYSGYILCDAKRAPRWKAIRSSIISSNSFIDILGDGDAGFVIHGEEFANSQRRKARDYINLAKGSTNPILGRYELQNVDKLIEHIDKMRVLLEKKPKVSDGNS